MNIYDIETIFNCSQKHSVVANTMADAEKTFLEKYPGTQIDQIILHSKYVLIAEPRP